MHFVSGPARYVVEASGSPVDENSNGLLRQYFPKKTELSDCSQAQLNAVARNSTAALDEHLAVCHHQRHSPSLLRRPV